MRAHAHTCAPSTRDTRHVAATETSRRGYTNCPRATLHSKPHRARRYESQRHNATNSGQQSAQKVPRDEGAAPRRHRLHAAQAASSGGTVRSGEAAGMHHTGRTCQVLVRPTSAAVQAAGSRQVKKARTSPSAHCTAIETTKHGPYPHIRTHTHTRDHHTHKPPRKQTKRGLGIIAPCWCRRTGTNIKCRAQRTQQQRVMQRQQRERQSCCRGKEVPLQVLQCSAAPTL